MNSTLNSELARGDIELKKSGGRFFPKLKNLAHRDPEGPKLNIQMDASDPLPPLIQQP